MNNILLIIKKLIEVLAPYAKKFWNSVNYLADTAGNSIKKSNKKAKMHLKLIKIKNILEIVSNITLILAALIAVACAVGDFLRKKR